MTALTISIGTKKKTETNIIKRHSLDSSNVDETSRRFFLLHVPPKHFKMSSSLISRTLVILIVSLASSGSGEDCVPRDFGHGSIVCVCNSTYCDSAARNVPDVGQYRMYESGKNGKRMSENLGRFEKNKSYEISDKNAVTIIVNHDERFQEIVGFGGAFTDSTGINIMTLSEGSQNHIFQSYFGANGSRYNLGRVPIAGTDFSTRFYTYDDNEDDVTLKKWQLTNDDFSYKIPTMKRALETSEDLRFVSASWTAPVWMKTNDNYTGIGFLKEEYFQVYADYLTKFLVEYKKRGIGIWAISTGNEPNSITAPFVMYNSMGWTPETMAKWVAENLGPTIADSESNETIILMLDDQRSYLPWYPAQVFQSVTAKDYIAGIAVHWYTDEIVVPQVIDITHSLYPDKFLLMTEGCVGNFPEDLQPVLLGDWSRAQRYIMHIMENLNHWMTGYIDWNLVLDAQGGPTWARNYVDSPIIVNPDNDEFFKQPTYYAIAHFSKFIVRGSTRIASTKKCCIQNIAFFTPDNETVVVLYNGNNATKTVTVADSQQGNITTDISPYSIITIIYRS